MYKKYNSKVTKPSFDKNLYEYKHKLRDYLTKNGWTPKLIIDALKKHRDEIEAVLGPIGVLPGERDLETYLFSVKPEDMPKHLLMVLLQAIFFVTGLKLVLCNNTDKAMWATPQGPVRKPEEFLIHDPPKGKTYTYDTCADYNKFYSDIGLTPKKRLMLFAEALTPDSTMTKEQLGHLEKIMFMCGDPIKTSAGMPKGDNGKNGKEDNPFEGGDLLRQAKEWFSEPISTS